MLNTHNPTTHYDHLSHNFWRRLFNDDSDITLIKTLIDDFLIQYDIDHMFYTENSSFYDSLSSDIEPCPEPTRGRVKLGGLLSLANGLQLVDVTEEIIDSVSAFIQTNGPEGFYCMNPIKPPVEIYDVQLPAYIEGLEQKATSLAYLLCGLLLDGQIENFTNMDLDSAAGAAYLEKRQQDAINFYCQASKDDTLKPVTNVLLWQHRTHGLHSIAAHLRQYDLTDSYPVNTFLNQNNVEIPLYRNLSSG
ncbi:MAG: hypothetical protein P1U61_01140 [Legionellaceae bacterium]|nr:hypothetical protein [Legionellaceae bacterium]